MALYCFFYHCNQYSRLSIFGHDGLCLPLRFGTGKFRDQCCSGDTFGLFYFYSLLPERQDHYHHSVYKKRLGKRVALLYSLANISLFSTITIGAALFWGAYAADVVFGEYFVLHQDRITRITLLIVILGLFSAIYTYLGGLSAVVRTDIIQFMVLISGGLVVMFMAVHHLGGWSALYTKRAPVDASASSLGSREVALDSYFWTVLIEHQLLVCQSVDCAKVFGCQKSEARPDRTDGGWADEIFDGCHHCGARYCIGGYFGG